MPITSWTPQRVLLPLQRAVLPSSIRTLAYAKAIAPGPNTRAKTKLRFITPTIAELDARDVGPSIYPIVKGSRPGERTTKGWFVIPGTSPTKVMQTINHPGTQAHPYLNEAAARFRGFYVTFARALLGRF